ncbi:MAG TPA: uracil-DNA glycosylase [Roseiflexaceae bacterium]|nr:uracil-DNA glycosylase [Roseiflexaceae bacterium]
MMITPDSPPTAPTATAIRAAAFAQLVVDVQACRRGPRMEGRARVLGPGNGDPSARVLVIAEAPGRLGADRSGVPLQGDQSGRQFEALLAHSGLARRDLFITNAVLCNPRDAQGRNAPPAEDELDRCADHLRATLALLDPAVVVTLGAVALRAPRRIAPHDLVLASAVGVAVPWDGRLLVPLYHPGPRARLHRSLDQQLQDFAQLGRLLRDLGAVPAQETR